MADNEKETLTVAGREVTISNPEKVLFPEAGYTKLDLARYYLTVADGALLGAGGRPNVLVRYPNGIDGEFFYQKRAPESRPPWIEVVSLHFPSGRTAEEVVPRDGAALVWMANLACLELHPHPVRADDLDHPDELRIDLDPVPGVEWTEVRSVARVVQAALADLGLAGWPKTSGSRGMHVYVRIERRWTFDDVRRAVVAALPQAARRARARPAVAPQDADPPAHRDRARRQERGCARRPRAVEEPPRRCRRASRAGRRPRRRNARPLPYVDADSRE